MSSTLGRKGLRVSALAAAIFACGLGTAAHAAEESWSQAPKSLAAIEREAGRELYIVGLKSAPVATYAGERAGLAAVPRRANGRLDVRSPAALAYVDALRGEHAGFLQALSSRVGRQVAPLAPHFQFFHAFNGMVLALTEDEAARLADDPMVALVEGYKEFPLATDAGPELIGAPSIWSGSTTPGNLATRGQGVVIGIIDSGANLGSPSFTDVDIDNFDHTNPLGTGNYLGWCNPSNPNHNPTRDVCNDKLIGGWDFTDTAAPGGSTEAAGFEDENGHGSHTASTAGGNRRQATIAGVSTDISGVAPRANLVIYDACYTNSAGQGLCPNVSTLGSINQVVADGIVDVVNYSISGSQSPWTDANAQAFLAAHNAGVFVAASAGNGTPTPGTTNHVAPWVTTVAASTHDRAFFGNTFNFVAPASPPADAQNVPLQPGAAPPFISSSIVAAPLILSPTYGDGSVNNDGCTPFAADAFTRGGTGGIALIRWGTGTSACGTIARVNAAALGGAVGVIFLADAPLNAAAGGTVPAWVINDTTRAAAIRAHLATSPATATATIAFPGQGFAGQADVMASFSLIGPTNFDLLKPDITGPGVGVLAAVSRWNRTPPPGSLNPAANDATGLLSGTSMSSPHIAGAAALVRAVHPSWTPMEVKSALISTAKTADVFKFSATSPATVPSDPFDRGGGRVDLTRAARAGLVLNETGANFSAANPATGGNPASLNLPSLQLRNCVGTCVVTRSVTSRAAGTTTWDASVVGLPAGVASVAPAQFTLESGESQTVTITINSASLSATAFSFGELVLAPAAPAPTGAPVTIVEQRFPIALRSAPPDIAVSQTAGLTATLRSNETTTVSFQVSNTGNPTINWALASGNQTAPLLAQTQFLGNGFISAQFAGRTPPNTGFYIADDFSVAGSAQVTTLRADGFALPGGQSLGATNSPFINFHVYADNNGEPAGAPEGFGAAPVYTLRVASNAAGLSLAGSNIAIDLVANGAPALNLATGRYWVVVFPEMPGNGSGSSTANPLWAWRITGVGAPVSGLAPRSITPSAASPAWGVPTLTGAPGPGPASGFTLAVNGTVGCGAPWLTPDVTSGSLGALGNATVTLTLAAGTLATGRYGAYTCVSSQGTDADEPMTLVPVTLDVLGDQLFRDGFEPAPTR
jgi:subtilisin family serine protease